MRDHLNSRAPEALLLHGTRYATGPHESLPASLLLDHGVVSVICEHNSEDPYDHHHNTVDLTGYLLLPGLINAHDHLHFALFPRLGNPLYRNYIEWGEHIHAIAGDLIAKHKSIAKEARLRWGGIRNLLCGVTTVCHHDPLWPPLASADFPTRVVQHYGWAHSLTSGGDVRHAYSSTGADLPFIIHIGEGADALAKREILALDRLGALRGNTVIVHGLAIDPDGIALIQRRHASIIVCPSSNHFLFHTLPDIALLSTASPIALGSDSPLTSTGDLLDEIRFITSHRNIDSAVAYRMVTTAPASLLRLHETDGTIRLNAPADLIAVRDTGFTPAARLAQLSVHDIELVLIAGRVHLASDHVRSRLPLTVQNSLEPLHIDHTLRWLRAPVQQLLRDAEAVLGTDQVHLGGRLLTAPRRTQAFSTPTPYSPNAARTL